MFGGAYQNEVDIAQKAVHRASIVTKDVMRGISSFDKSDDSPVTVADFAAQALIICAIHHYFPQDSFIAEESADMLRTNASVLEKVWKVVQSAKSISSINASENGQPQSLPLPSDKEEMMKFIDMGSLPEGPKEGRIWILDPIDGTATFLTSKQYAVCLCLTVSGKQTVAALGCPNLSEKVSSTYASVTEDITDQDGYGWLFSAVAEQGWTASQMERATILKPTTMLPAPEKDVSQFTFIDSKKSSHADIPAHQKIYKLLNIEQRPIDIWSMQMKYIALATMSVDAMVRLPPKLDYRACVWDHAGGQLIYEMAGGKITDMYGQPFQYGTYRQFKDNCGYVCARSDVHGQILEVVKQVLAERESNASSS